MCCILVVEKKSPSWDILEKCNAKNDDGCSVSWLNDNGNAEYKKGLKLKELWEIIPNIPLPYVLHFRLASIGIAIDPLLTHPFEVSEDSPLRLQGEAKKLLIHNGTIKEYEWLLAGAGIDLNKSELMSDTRAIAKVISKDNEKLLWKLPGNFVIVDSIRDRVRMVGNWIIEDGIHYSNTLWKYHNSGQCCVGHNNNQNNYLSESYKKTYTYPTTTNQKKDTQVIKIEEKKESKKNSSYQIVKLNKEMTESQYNSGIFYNKKNNNVTPLMRNAMKERRKWWIFYYSPDLFWETTGRKKYVEQDKCYICSNPILSCRAKTLILLGTKKSELTCPDCARAFNLSTEFTNSIITPKMTRNINIPIPALIT